MVTCPLLLQDLQASQVEDAPSSASKETQQVRMYIRVYMYTCIYVHKDSDGNHVAGHGDGRDLVKNDGDEYETEDAVKVVLSKDEGTNEEGRWWPAGIQGQGGRSGL